MFFTNIQKLFHADKIKSVAKWKENFFNGRVGGDSVVEFYYALSLGVSGHRILIDLAVPQDIIGQNQ